MGGSLEERTLIPKEAAEKKLKHATQKRVVWTLSFGTDLTDDYYESMDDVRNSTLSMEAKRALFRKLKEKDPTSLEESSVLRQQQSGNKISPFSGLKKRIFNRSKIQEAIEGRYGSSVYSVFKLIKWVSCLNFMNALILFFLIYLPHELKNRKQEGSWSSRSANRSCHVYENNYVESSTASDCCSQIYKRSSEEAWNFFSGENVWKKSLQFVQDIAQGTNWLSFSPMFYGFYEGTYVFKIGEGTYDFPLAYFLVILMIFFINLFAVVRSSSRSFNFIHSSSKSFSLLDTVFTGWNHFDVRSRAQKEILHEYFHNFFLLGMKLLERVQVKNNQSKMDRLKQNLLRVIIHILTIAALALTGFGVVTLNSKVIPSLFEDYQCNAELDVSIFSKCFLIRYLSAFTILVIGTTFPFIFERLVKIEDYDHKTSLVFLIGRSLMVRLGAIILTYWSLLQGVQCPYIQGCANKDGSVTYGSCSSANYGINVKACSNENNSFGFCKKGICWETYVGQQIYTLAIMDLAASFAFIFLIDLPRSILFKGRVPFLGRVEFNIGKNVLDAVDSQTICWLGLFYTPFLSLLIGFINLLLYYIKAFYLLKVCTPVFSESNTSSLFKYFLLISFASCVTVIGITIYTSEPSIGCGPFRNVDCSGISHSNTVFCITYDYIIKGIMRQSLRVQKMIFFFGEPLILYSIVGLLFIALYLSNANMFLRKKFHSELRSLKNKLIVQNKDLLKAIENKKFNGSPLNDD